MSELQEDHHQMDLACQILKGDGPWLHRSRSLLPLYLNPNRENCGVLRRPNLEFRKTHVLAVTHSAHSATKRSSICPPDHAFFLGAWFIPISSTGPQRSLPPQPLTVFLRTSGVMFSSSCFWLNPFSCYSWVPVFLCLFLSLGLLTSALMQLGLASNSLCSQLGCPSWSSCLYLSSIKITGVHHHTRFCVILESNPGALCTRGKHSSNCYFSKSVSGASTSLSWGKLVLNFWSSPSPLKCWDYRYIPPRLVLINFSEVLWP